MKELSIFVDESGDFGAYNSKYAPQYIFSMVFHEQNNNLEDCIKHYEKEMLKLGFNNHVVHTFPLIRKEEVYCNFSPNERRTIFTKLFFFAKSAPIQYKTFVFERKECKESLELKNRIRKCLERFILENYVYFASFDRVILYYDNGQKQLGSILDDVLSEQLSVFDRKKNVKPYKYVLIQVADMICTLELLSIKVEHNNLTESEKCIFHSARDLKKDFLKKIKKKEFYYNS